MPAYTWSDSLLTTHPSHSQQPPETVVLQRRRAAHRSPSGDVKEPRSPRLNAFPRLMSATVRAAHAAAARTQACIVPSGPGDNGRLFPLGSATPSFSRHTAWQPEPRGPVPCFRELGESPSAVLCTGSPKGALLSQGPPGKLVVSSVIWMLSENQDLNVSGPLGIKSS